MASHAATVDRLAAPVGRPPTPLYTRSEIRTDRCVAGTPLVTEGGRLAPPATTLPHRQGTCRRSERVLGTRRGGGAAGGGWRVPALAAPAGVDWPGAEGAPRRERARCAGRAVVVAAAPAAQAAPKAPRLKAGVGKADITPQTGYYLGGWTRADRVAQGQHTRLFSRAMVLERDGRKVALVQVDLFMVPGGMVKQIGEILAARGFSERNILISASHTHSGPGGYANFPTLNTAAPSLQTATDPLSFARFLAPDKADPQLYAFLTRQISTAIRRADDDRATAAAGWGSSRILGLTRNRSLEAHLANHGVIKDRGDGKEADDPGGYEHTIDPDVDVLRVDKLRRAKRTRLRRVPIGAWSTFADHGTVTKSSFQYYNADHHASAMRVFEERVRERGQGAGRSRRCSTSTATPTRATCRPASTRSGPAASDYVGRVEAAAMYQAWRSARRSSSRYPASRAAGRACASAARWSRTASGWPDESQVGHAVPDRLRGGARAAVRHHGRGVRGPARAGRRTAARGQGLGARRRRRRAQRRAAAGVPDGAADDRVAAGRGHQGDGRADQGGGAVADRGVGDRRRGAVRPGERVHPLPDHAAGVRPPALRGRQHPVRAPVGEPAQERDRRTWRGGWRAASRRRRRTTSTPPTASSPAAPTTGPARPRQAR